MYHEKYFLEISCLRYGGESSPRPFVKKSELSISLNQQFEVQFVFIACPSRGLLNYI